MEDDELSADTEPLLNKQLLPLEVFLNDTFELHIRGMAMPVAARMFFPIPQLILMWPIYREWKVQPVASDFSTHFFKIMQDRNMSRGAAVPLIVTSSIIAYLFSGKFKHEVSLVEVFLPWWLAIGGVILSAVPNMLASRNQDELQKMKKRRMALRISKLLQVPAHVIDALACVELENLDKFLEDTIVTTKYVLERHRIRSADINQFPDARISLCNFLNMLIPWEASNPGHWVLKRHMAVRGVERSSMCDRYQWLLAEADIFNASAHTACFVRRLNRIEAMDAEIALPGIKDEEALLHWKQRCLPSFSQHLGIHDTKIPVTYLAHQFLVGIPAVDNNARSACWRMIVLGQRVVSALVVIYMVLLPSLLRSKSLEQGLSFPGSAGTVWVALVYIIWGCINLITLCFVAHTWALQSLFTQMLRNINALNSMLKGSAVACLPALQSGDMEHLRVCTEIRGLFLAAKRGQKVLLEANLAFVLLTVAVMLAINLYCVLRESPNTELVFVIAMLLMLLVTINGLAAICIGFQAARAAHQTEKLLAQESVVPNRLGNAVG